MKLVLLITHSRHLCFTLSYIQQINPHCTLIKQNFICFGHLILSSLTLNFWDKNVAMALIWNLPALPLEAEKKKKEKEKKDHKGQNK